MANSLDSTILPKIPAAADDIDREIISAWRKLDGLSQRRFLLLLRQVSTLAAAQIGEVAR